MDAIEESHDIAWWFIDRIGELTAWEREYIKQGKTGGEERRLARWAHNLCEQMMKHIKMNLKNCLNIGSEDSAMDYAFMFSAIESCDVNRLSPEAYLRNLILGLHEKKVEKKQFLPCYIRL